MQHLDEGTIHAWLDGQLPRDEAQAVEAHVAECRQCADAVAEARGLIAASSRILMSLDAVPRDVVPLPAATRVEPAGPTVAPMVLPHTASRAEQRAVRRWFSGPSLAAAAAVIVAVGTVTLMRAGSRAPAPLAETSASLAPVSGPMADTTMVSAPSPAAPAPIAPYASSSRLPFGASIASGKAANQPQVASAPADARAEARAQASQKVADAKAEDASSQRGALGESVPPQRLAAQTDSGRAKDGLLDRAQVSRQTITPPEQRQLVARDELKKVPAAESVLAREKPSRDSSAQIVVRGMSALAERSNAAGGRADAAAGATATTGAVRGRITDANNTGLAGAMVSVVGTGTAVPTNSTGEFTLGGLEPGARRLRVMRIGYEPINREITVAAGQTITADIVLTPAQIALSEVIVTGAGSTQATPSQSSAQTRKRASAPSIETPPGAPVTAAQSNAVGCYELGVTASSAQARTGFRQVPRRVALDAEIVPANAEGVWYRARDLSRVGTLPNGLWRPAGPDAVELEWAYGTRTDRVRLSGAAGSMMRGTIEEIDRATATGEAGTVVAVRRPCDGQ